MRLVTRILYSLCRRIAVLGARSAAGRRNERGSTVTEFALAVPIFLMLTIGLMDFSIAVWSRHTIVYAAHEGARYAIVHGAMSKDPASSEDIAHVVTELATGLDPQNVEVMTTWDPNNKPGSTVQVVVRYPFESITPFLAGQEVTLEATAAMTVWQ